MPLFLWQVIKARVIYFLKFSTPYIKLRNYFFFYMKFMVFKNFYIIFDELSFIKNCIRFICILLLNVKIIKTVRYKKQTFRLNRNNFSAEKKYWNTHRIETSKKNTKRSTKKCHAIFRTSNESHINPPPLFAGVSETRK